MSTATIDPEQIRKELSALWVSLAEEKDKSAGVLRACSMTLIVAACETEDTSPIGETLAMLMREHPSRAILVRVRETAERFLSSRVLAHCWMPFGDRRQICCEQVEITASSASIGDVPAVLLPLAVADLPVVLWCRGSFGIDALSPIAEKVIVDSAELPGFPPVIELTRVHRVADLAWTRLTRWRELIAQIFENKAYLAELPNITRARMVYAGDAPTTSEFYLAAWLGRQEIVWHRGPHSAVVLEFADGQVHTAIRSTDAETNVDVEVRGKMTRTVFPNPTDYILLNEELSIPGRDPVFEAVLPNAAMLAIDFAASQITRQ